MLCVSLGYVTLISVKLRRFRSKRKEDFFFKLRYVLTAFVEFCSVILCLVTLCFDKVNIQKKGLKMKTIRAQIEGVSPISFSKYVQVEKLEKESHDDYEKRTWKERLHINTDGYVFVPPMMLKNALSEAAKYLSIQIPGKGKATYTKHFEAGVLCYDPIVFAVKKNDVQGEWLHVPSDGKRGGTKRVAKCFPIIHKWGGEAIYHIFDETITDDVFKYVLEQAGKFIGLGRFRPRNNGYYGRFKVVSMRTE